MYSLFLSDFSEFVCEYAAVSVPPGVIGVAQVQILLCPGLGRRVVGVLYGAGTNSGCPCPLRHLF